VRSDLEIVQELETDVTNRAVSFIRGVPSNHRHREPVLALRGLVVAAIQRCQRDTGAPRSRLPGRYQQSKVIKIMRLVLEAVVPHKNITTDRLTI
jgi:hypothetical protein